MRNMRERPAARRLTQRRQGTHKEQQFYVCPHWTLFVLAVAATLNDIGQAGFEPTFFASHVRSSRYTELYAKLVPPTGIEPASPRLKVW